MDTLISRMPIFIDNPKPDCYLRELSIANVDTKFIERHKGIIKSLLDILLPESPINREYENLSHHGFEKRFSCRYEQPRIRFRLLDQQMTCEFNGLSDIEISLLTRTGSRRKTADSYTVSVHNFEFLL